VHCIIILTTLINSQHDETFAQLFIQASNSIWCNILKENQVI